MDVLKEFRVKEQDTPKVEIPIDHVEEWQLSVFLSVALQVQQFFENGSLNEEDKHAAIEMTQVKDAEEPKKHY